MEELEKRRYWVSWVSSRHCEAGFFFSFAHSLALYLCNICIVDIRV
jgi:hypothetical protein